MEGERAAGGRRLRRVSVKKPVVVSSDDEDGADAEINKNEEQENYALGDDEDVKPRKKTAKKNAKKKTKKLTNGGGKTKKL